jgi:hypothetical protein
MNFKQKTVRDKKYISWLKTLPCLLCGKESEPHHVNVKGFGGKGIKTADQRSIPVCHEHHMEIHNNGRDSFATKYNLDYENIIQRLRKVYNESNGICE